MKTLLILSLVSTVFLTGCIRFRTEEEKKDAVIAPLQLDCKMGSIGWHTLYKCEVEGKKTCYIFTGIEKGGIWCE